LAERIQGLHREGKTYVVGLCGGYQMLGESIHDPDGVESPLRELPGLGLIPMVTRMEPRKTTVLSRGTASFAGKQLELEGYEIHMGQSVIAQNDAPFIQLEDRTDGYCTQEKQLIGTYFHGLFHNDDFRTLLLNAIREKKGLSPITDRPSFIALREQGYDLLADTVRQHVNIEAIEEQMRLYQENEVNAG
jgi:adenosylcobyric acid synthase